MSTETERSVATLAMLEKVFAGEVSYDDALEQLDLHTAYVRRTYPNLLKAMQQREMPPAVDPAIAEQLARLQEQLAAMTRTVGPSSIKVMTAPPAQPTGDIPQVIEVQDEEAAIKSMPYSEWATKVAPTAQEGQEWAVKWDMPLDNPKAPPPPQVTSTFVLSNREGGGKTRFHVINSLDETTLVFRAVKIFR